MTVSEVRERLTHAGLDVAEEFAVWVDWTYREAARARIRVLAKKFLRKYGYPLDLQDAAVQIALQQAEALSADWAVA